MKWLKMIKDGLLQQMKAVPYANLTDGSNTSTRKLYPIVINYFDGKLISCSVFSLQNLEEAGTGENIVQLLITPLTLINPRT